MGKDLDPMEDSIWRAGANEATTFAISKDVMVEGQKLPAGRYALFTIKHGNEWTLIFNKEWNTWGAYSYKQNMAKDALKVKVQQQEALRLSNIVITLNYKKFPHHFFTLLQTAVWW